MTWTNKHLRLLAHEDGSYEWVDPADYRVAEVRLLQDVETVGEVASHEHRARDNLLIRGDALNALASLAELPEFADEYLGKVRLAYLDPPFNTQQSFLQYDDALEHSVWLTMMRDRLQQVKRLLEPERGSVWVHCDDSEQGHLRVLMDEIFGRSQFVATVVWQKRYSRENRAAIGTVHDYLLVYSPLGVDWRDYRNRLPRDERTAKQYRNPTNDPRGPWRVLPMTAQGYRPNQMYPITSPGGLVHYPPKGRCWSMVQDRFEQLRAQGRIYFGKDGRSVPGVIRYLDETEGLVPWTWWPSEEVGHSDESRKEVLSLFPHQEPFTTAKPERLLQRILHVGSKPGEVVLDPFLGSGTTAAVAHKMGRRWIGIERSTDTLDRYAVPRMSTVTREGAPAALPTMPLGKAAAAFASSTLAPRCSRPSRAPST